VFINPKIELSINIIMKKTFDKILHPTKINLLLLFFLILITNGVYLPIWFLQQDSFLRFNKIKHGVLKKWILVFTTIIMAGTVGARTWYSVKLRDLATTNQSLIFENIADNTEGLSKSSEYLDLLTEYEAFGLNLTMANIIIGIMGLILITYSFNLRNAVNIILRKNNKKTISTWLFGIVGIITYLFFAVLGSTEIALLWSVFPLAIIMQYRINRLYNKPNALKNE